MRTIMCKLGWHKYLFGFVHDAQRGLWYDKCQHCGEETAPYSINEV